MKKPNNGARKRTQSRQNSPKNRPKNAVKNAGKNPQKNTKKTSQKSTQKDTATPCGCGAWLVYTDLSTKHPNFRPPKLHKNAPFDGVNWHEIHSNFSDYLDHEKLSIQKLQGEKLALSRLHTYMKSKAPHLHRAGGCLERRVRAIENGKERGVKVTFDKVSGEIGAGNVARCFDPFCCYCNEYDGQQALEKAIKVQETHIANTGGDCLQLTFTAHHTIKTRLEPFKKLMQKAFTLFTRWTAKALQNVGLAGKLKRNDWGYSFKNGHHFHIHLALAIGAIDDDGLAELGEYLREMWLKALLNVGLAKENKKGETPKASNDKAFDIKKSDFAFSYVAKKHPSKFTQADLQAIKNKSKDKALSVFELAFLAMNGEFDGGKFQEIYAELLGAWHGLTTLKYSKNFLDDLGLMQYEQESPKQGDTATQTATATDTQDNTTTPKNATKRPKKRYIYERKRDLVTLCDINWFLWLELKKTNEHLILLGMLKHAYKQGYYSIE